MARTASEVEAFFHHNYRVTNDVNWSRPDLGPCWLWTLPVHRGYGRIRTETRQVGVHRYSYELHNGPIPGGLDVDHLCHEPADCPGGVTCPHRACVAPAHLDATDPASNRRRGHTDRAGGRDHYLGARDECKWGHPLDEANSHWNGRQRICRICEQDRSSRRTAKRKAKRAAARAANPKKPATHCRNGHEWTEENTAYDSDGYRACKQCNRDKAKRHYDRNRGA